MRMIVENKFKEFYVVLELFDGEKLFDFMTAQMGDCMS